MKINILIDNITKSDMAAEWGLAIYIEYEGRKFLLDAGTTGACFANAKAMGINTAEVGYGVLSHAHYDHADGLETFFRENTKAKVYIREACRENCYDAAHEPPKYIGIKEGYLEKYKNRMVYVSGDYELCPGVKLIPHKTQGLAGLGEKTGMYVKCGDTFCPDCFDHEQSLVFETKKGLVILNSCSHGGAGNIIREVAETYPGREIYALIGGFHLFKSSDEDVRAMAEEIRQTGIRQIYTGHCTGERAMGILKESLGEMAHQIYTGMEILIS